MGESRRFKHKRRLGIITTVLLLILIIYFAVQIFGKTSSSISVINTQSVTDKSFWSFGGYVYRDEEIITAGDGEIADFLVSDGEKIPVGKEYMTLYKTNISDMSELRAVQGEISELSGKIQMLKDGLDGGYRIQDISGVKASLDASYYSYISSVASGNYPMADTDADKMLDLLGKQQMITGKLDSIKNSADAISEQKRALIEKYASGGGRAVKADRSCYVSFGVDGYESAFNYADVMTMTAEQFREKTAEPVKAGLDGAVAKKVYGSKWYLAVPVSRAEIPSFSVGSSCDVYLSEIGNDSIPMTVEKIEISENGESGFAVLSSSEIGKSFELSRYTSIKILRSSVHGLRVPEEAIHSLDFDRDGYTDHTGVYVMSGNYVKFRRIEIISYGTGYVIVKDGDPAEEEQQFPYLSGGELIIVSGGDLYDGKLIK